MIIPHELRYAYEALISAVSGIINGLITHQGTLGVKQNTHEEFTTALEALNGKEGQPGSDALYNAAAVDLEEKSGALRLALAASRTLARSTVNVLKNVFGNQINSAWQAVGFTETLSIPTDPYGVLSRMANYLETNPVAEVANQGVTCVNIRAQLVTLANARQAKQNAMETAARAKEQRDKDWEALYKRVVGLRSELLPLLSATDIRWYAFGFPRPIDGRIPTPVADLAANPIAAGTVELTWTASARAKGYRVKWYLKATPEEVITVGLTAEVAITLHNLASGVPIVAQVSAYNGSGETKVAEVEFTLP